MKQSLRPVAHPQYRILAANAAKTVLKAMGKGYRIKRAISLPRENAWWMAWEMESEKGEAVGTIVVYLFGGGRTVAHVDVVLYDTHRVTRERGGRLEEYEVLFTRLFPAHENKYQITVRPT